VFVRYRLLALVVLVTAAVDQGTKLAAVALLAGGREPVLLPELLTLRLRHNSGVAWGLGAGAGETISSVLFPLLGVLVAAVLVFLYKKTSPEDRVLRVGLALLVGGGLGNWIDRVRLGQVIDFVGIEMARIGLPLSGTFNVADVAMILGLVSVGAAVLRRSREVSGEREKETR